MLSRSLRRLFFLALLAVTALGHAQSPRFSEAEVKAAFLYRFTQFVEWPADARAQDTLVIGVMGSDPVDAELRRTIPAPVSGTRNYVIRRIEPGDSVAGIHVLFIGRRENAHIPKIIAGLGRNPVLVVTEVANGLELGSIINFITTDRVQFEISLAAAVRSNLHLNARLLSVASRLKKGSISAATTA